jgi:hypothetical protein
LPRYVERHKAVGLEERPEPEQPAVERRCDRRVSVISLTQSRCEVLQEGKARIEVGVEMTTADSFYDPK